MKYHRTTAVLIIFVLIFAGSIGAIRITDVHFGPEKTISENPTPQERVAFGLADLSRQNYRMESTGVSRNRTSGNVWYQGRVVQRVNHNSEQIYISEHSRWFDDENSFYHYISKRDAWRAIVHNTEWQLTPKKDVWGRSGDRYSPTNHRIPLNASAEWRVINKTDQSVIVGVESTDEYRQAFEISRPFRTVSNGSVYIHFDSETGVITKVVVNEVSTVELDWKENRIPSERRLVYEFDRSGDISITPPEPARGFSFKGLLVDLIEY